MNSKIFFFFFICCAIAVTTVSALDLLKEMGGHGEGVGDTLLNPAPALDQLLNEKDSKNKGGDLIPKIL
ncbi:unnamed protein product [Arctia plantaginis]|uniref:Uncharacterized protein n=1 Tax=Arctia plantaginis TaxID=874455 RepID=A0A8S1B7F0_ARCPL|nr:unnamed protein product [Arctia plantaginis]